MTSKPIIFVLGLAIGAAACAVVLSKKSHPETPNVVATLSSSTSADQIKELKAELAAAKTQLEKANADNDKLAARVQESLKRESAPPAAAEKPQKPRGLAAMFGGDGTNGMSEAMTGMMKASMAQQIEGKLAGMKLKLNLTPEQEKALREVMEKQMTRNIETAQKMFSGETSPEEMGKLGQNIKGEEEQIKELLTPEQTTAYGEYQKEEKLRMTRLAANGELMQMQSSLQLNDEQQDKVFEVLVAQEQVASDVDFKDFQPDSGTSFMRKRLEKKIEALRGVLTPEQLERYQTMEEQQLKMMEAFAPKLTTNENGHIEFTFPAHSE